MTHYESVINARKEWDRQMNQTFEDELNEIKNHQDDEMIFWGGNYCPRKMYYTVVWNKKRKSIEVLNVSESATNEDVILVSIPKDIWYSFEQMLRNEGRSYGDLDKQSFDNDFRNFLRERNQL